MPADKQVLLLDIRAAERGRLAALINKLGYVVTHAEDVATAQAICERDAFPIMIVDLRDPHADLTELHAQLPASAIIAIGARTLAGALDAWHAGADGYLPRPVRQSELTDALDQILHTRAVRLAAVRLERSALAEFRRMAAELAHQLNAPLTPLLGMADLLAEELPPAHLGHAYAQAITAAAIRIRDVAWMLADIAQQSR